jgi:ribonuclease BN (tRNA processing enzyme)
MELVVLGSGTVAPSARRTAPAHWVTAGEVRLLLDCGAGMLHRAAGFGIRWPDVTHVALTHFHPDHWGELPMLLFALRWGTLPARSALLNVIGPPGLRTRMTVLAGALGDWVLEPGYPLEMLEIAAGDSLELSGDVVLEAWTRSPTSGRLRYI